MRFGIKTAPQHTSWEDMLDVWRAADEVELFETAWNFDHFYPLQGAKTAPVWRDGLPCRPWLRRLLASALGVW